MNAQLIWPYYQILVGTGTIIIAIAAVMIAWSVFQARPQSINDLFRDYMRGYLKLHPSDFVQFHNYRIDREKILYYRPYEIADAGVWQIEVIFISGPKLTLNYNDNDEYLEELEKLDKLVSIV